MALDRLGLGATWEDEEERKRREREARAQQRLGTAGAPIRIKNQPVQRTTPAQPDKQLTNKRRIDEQLTPYFNEVSKDAGRRMATKDGKATGLLTEYFALRNKVGEEKLLDRFNGVASMADKYMSDYDISGLVWDLVRSPYSEEQIEFMLRKGSKALYDPERRRPGMPPVSQQLLKRLGADPDDELMGEEVGRLLRETGGFGSIAKGTPRMNARTAKEQVDVTLADVGRFAQWFGEKIGGVLEHYSPEVAAERQMDEIARNRARNKGIDERFARFATPGYETFKAFIDENRNRPLTELKEMQLAVQRDQVDEGNNIVREGYGKDLEAKGVMTREWQDVFEKDWRRVNREIVTMQRMLLAQGYAADNLEPDGDLTTPEWQEAVAKYQVQQAKNAEWFKDDPEGFSVAQMIGSPSATGGYMALARRLLTHGAPQMVYGSGVTAAKAIAGGVAALFASADLNARAQNSPTTVAVVDDAWAYLQTKLSEEQQRKFLLFSRPSDVRHEVVKELETLAESDPIAKEKLDAVNVELGMLITTRFRPNVYTTVGHQLGLPYGEVERSYQNNLDRNEGINFVAEIVGSAAFGGAVRASRAIKPLARTESALTASVRATGIVERSLDYIKSRDFFRAAQELQGGDAPRVVKTIDDAVNGRNTSLVKGTWNDLATQVEQGIKADNKQALRELLPNVKDIDEFVTDIQKRTNGVLTPTKPPTRLTLNKPPSKRLSTEIAGLVSRRTRPWVTFSRLWRRTYPTHRREPRHSKH